MTPSPPDAAPARPCPRCGALNGENFDRCIRCGALFSALAAQAGRVGNRLNGQNLLATKILIGLTCLIFAAQLRAALARGEDVPVLPGGDHVADAIRVGSLLILPGQPFEPWRLLSAVFVHFGIIHFGMNMLALTNLARIAEPATGSARFTIAYVITGIIGFGASVAWSAFVDRQVIHTAGASGAIFGVMGLILGVLIRRRDPRWKQFALKAVLYSLLFGLMIRANNAAHLGGLLAGIGFGLLFAGPRRQRLEFAVNVAAVASLIACVVALALAQMSPLWSRIDALYSARDSGAAGAPAPRVLAGG